MFLTTKGRYAVAAMIDIITNGNGKTPISLAQIAERQNISISYLEQIFLQLKKHNLVKSVKGPGGGYIVDRDPSQIPVAEILLAAGETVKMTKCQGSKNCTGTSAKCKTHHIWATFENKIAKYLTSTTMADILEPNSNFFKLDELRS